MGITRLKVSNFKSFDQLDLELRPLNILVGANAAGKSNFLEIFRFLRDLAESGLENAVALQGAGYVASLRIGSHRPTKVEISACVPENLPFLTLQLVGGTVLRARRRETTYRLELQIGDPRRNPKVLSETIAHCCEVLREDLGTQLMQSLGPGEMVISRKGRVVGKALSVRDHPEMSVSESISSKGFGLLDVENELPEDETLLQRSELRPIPHLSFFDFDPSLPKRTNPVVGRAELDSNGDNLAIVLNGIMKDPQRARRFSLLLKDVLPFVEGVRVDQQADKSLLLLLQESYSGPYLLPAPFLSNGTVNLMALILALYFDRADVTIIEEPERNIHPHLISRVVDMMKDASTTRQIVTTTHNPELVKHAALDDLLLVSRDENGFSRITRPAENEELKIFLENELGVDELYVQGLLGSGHGV